MAKWCPEIDDYVLYTECLECETKTCEKLSKKNLKNDVKNT